ncbi:hypothetical protein [Enterococcus raffinosus]|jgi:uncharacterized Zn finger protein|uniref:hypothetical protein n=1 Tax=Enterococcus raffinosus TaxID=71452 RepID=UPI0021BBCF5C|nr:hypothetical protein [Enterococcus raffinosus]
MKKKKKQLLKSFDSIGTINYSCLNCGVKEKIPKDVVQFLDAGDVGDDPENAPQFECEKCGGEMYPEYYKNAFGYEFRISDRK